jgi:hypothetical protein
LDRDNLGGRSWDTVRSSSEKEGAAAEEQGEDGHHGSFHDNRFLHSGFFTSRHCCCTGERADAALLPGRDMRWKSWATRLNTLQTRLCTMGSPFLPATGE